MKYYISLFIFISFWLKGISQEEIITITSNSTVYQSFNVVDTKTGNFAVFLEEDFVLKGYLYNSDYQLIGKIYSDDLPDKYKIFIGYQIANNTITVFMKSRNNKSFGIIKFDFEKEVSSVEKLDFKLKKEYYVESINTNNSFYLITRPKNKSQYNIYTFNEDFSVNLHEIVFKKEDILDRKDRPIPLYEIIDNPIKINNESPSAIETTSNYCKLYVDKNNVTITSDNYNEFTFLVRINLDTFSYSTERFFSPLYKSSSIGVKSNSYIYKGKLFQLICNSKKLDITIKDLSTNKILKQYSANKENPIDFKNSKISQEGGMFKKNRELDKTSQFLRKMSQSKVGVSAYFQDGVYQISMGGFIEVSNFYGSNINMSPVGGITSVLFNPMTFSYYGYSGSKSIQITGLFNEDFKHLEGETIKNPFDLIDGFLKDNNIFSAKTIFKYKENFMFGFYNKRTNLFKVFKI